MIDHRSNRKRRCRASASIAVSQAPAWIALALGLVLVPLQATDAAARRPTSEVALPPETATQEALPIPPIPPDTPPAFSAAPVPNGEPAPTPGETPDTGATLGPGVFSQQKVGQGNGYLYGSTVQDERDRRTPPAGFQLNMPLQ